jgi:hypothetical protein
LHNASGQRYHRFMTTLYDRDIPEDLYRQVQKIAQKEERSLSSYVVLLFQRATEEDKLGRKRSRALTSLRRRRQPLPSGAPDADEVLRKIRQRE